ncbi:hypothetical protein GP486_001011 [Trichoglossum hirsutum]|uniref:Exosome complex component RRP45 n=1 Tax=Trichoglossum hirsutum TaxID=265104 RepID=A0A9P8LHH5_9PEZI|nr:hypothetical protein GP486_001011 [Trichoglossum hirsutum]
MPREPGLSLNERSFILQALQENIRIDGRSFDAFRDLDLNFGDEVISRISAEVAKPFPDRLCDGIFTITTELSPVASPAFEVGRQTDQEVILSRTLEKAIRRSGALDTESLCIIAGQKCWSIRADVHLLDYDGGLVDASCIAVIAALQHFRRPDVSIEGEDVTVHTMEERVPVPLSLLHHPICVTFSFFLGGDVVLIDATLQEELLRNGELIIAVNRHGEVCQIAKLGGVAIEALTLLNCANVALTKAQWITRFISSKLEEDLRAKTPGSLLAELSAENER